MDEVIRTASPNAHHNTQVGLSPLTTIPSDYPTTNIYSREETFKWRTSGVNSHKKNNLGSLIQLQARY